MKSICGRRWPCNEQTRESIGTHHGFGLLRRSWSSSGLTRKGHACVCGRPGRCRCLGGTLLGVDHANRSRYPGMRYVAPVDQPDEEGTTAGDEVLGRGGRDGRDEGCLEWRCTWCGDTAHRSQSSGGSGYWLGSDSPRDGTRGSGDFCLFLDPSSDATPILKY